MLINRTNKSSSRYVAFCIAICYMLCASSGYSQQIKAPVEQREIAMTLLNLEVDDPNHGIRWIREINSAGATVIIMTVAWDRVYPDSN
ncbi:MAG: hypothetical protein NWQ46_03535, partial [Spirosomaceae bacterium]|nr:hypothetical protein [Spirosomataceae bacterium]